MFSFLLYVIQDGLYYRTCDQRSYQNNSAGQSREWLLRGKKGGEQRLWNGNILAEPSICSQIKKEFVTFSRFCKEKHLYGVTATWAQGSQVSLPLPGNGQHILAWLLFGIESYPRLFTFDAFSTQTFLLVLKHPLILCSSVMWWVETCNTNFSFHPSL